MHSQVRVMKRFPLFLTMMVILCTAACTNPVVQQDDDSLYPERKLVSSKYLGKISSSTVSRKNSGVDKSYYKSGVKYYRLIYKTLFRGEVIEASALLMIPDNVTSSDILIYNHGTTAPLDELGKVAMSEYDGSMLQYQVNKCVVPFASNGYFVVAPDYVGYGVTADIEHPYTYYPVLVEACVDALYAATEFLDENGFGYSDNLLLTGWSQGAGASLAMQQTIESMDTGWNVINSILSGPYDFRAFMDDIICHPSKVYIAMFCYAWSAYTMNVFSDYMQFPLDQIFRKEVTDQYSAIATAAGATAEQVFQDSFMKSFLENKCEAINKTVEELTISEGWKPLGKVFLHHGKSDDVVPYFNSENAFRGLSAAGGDVTLYTYDGGGHFSLFKEYVEATLDDFNSLRQ